MFFRYLNFLKLPLWMGALATGSKSFIDNPIIGSKRLNQFGLHRYRVWLAAKMTAYRRNYFLERHISLEDKIAIHENGFILQPDFLPQQKFETLRREIMESKWPLWEMRQGGTITRRVWLDSKRLQSSHPELAQLITDRDLINRIRYVASTKGQPLFFIQAILTDPEIPEEDPQSVVHADTFHSNAKAWFFLFDVEEKHGPFAYVPGSNKPTTQRLDWEHQQSIEASAHSVRYHARGSFRATEGDLKKLDLPQPQKFCVPSNTLVIGDTFGFHRRTPTRHKSCRIEIYATLRRNPFLPWPGLHFFSLPYIRTNSGSFSISALKLMKKLKLRKIVPWTYTGTRPIDAQATQDTA
jgi:hypothetical protein